MATSNENVFATFTEYVSKADKLHSSLWDLPPGNEVILYFILFCLVFRCREFVKGYEMLTTSPWLIKDGSKLNMEKNEILESKYKRQSEYFIME